MQAVSRRVSNRIQRAIKDLVSVSYKRANQTKVSRYLQRR